MDEKQLLITAIINNSNEDIPRLMYADHCEEKGDSERAQFIRDQINLANMIPDDEGLSNLRDECEITLARNLVHWIRTDLQHNPAMPINVECNYTRGFIEGLIVSDELFDRLGPKWMGLAPITSLEYRGTVDYSRLVANRLIDRITNLAFTKGQLQNENAEELAYSPNVTNVARLSFDNTPVDPSSVSGILANSSNFQSLRDLHLSATQATLETITAIAHAPRSTQLLRLGLGSNLLGDEALLRLTASEKLCNLTELYLWGCGITDVGIEALASSALGRNLNVLSVGNNQLSPNCRDRLDDLFPGILFQNGYGIRGRRPEPEGWMSLEAVRSESTTGRKSFEKILRPQDGDDKSRSPQSSGGRE